MTFPHIIRDPSKPMPINYREVTGISPGAYLMMWAQHSEHGAEALDKYLGGGGYRLWNQVYSNSNTPFKPVAAPPHLVTFRPGEPKTFDEYTGQEQFTPFLEAEVLTIPEDRAMLTRPQLFLGPPGLGKTLLAKVIANEIGLELKRRGQPQPDFILALGSDLTERTALDTLIRRAAAKPGNVLFIDEIHTLVSSANIDKWLLLTDEHRWQFAGEADPTPLADFTILGATTDYGAIPAPLRRRFAERQLKPLTEQAIVGLLESRFRVTHTAADLAASRTHHGGAPWEGIALLTEAQVLTRARRQTIIESQDVAEVFRIWDLDDLGLRPHDRAVIKALLTQRREVKRPPAEKHLPPLVVYAASEDATVSMARVDREAYRLDIKPRLMARGLLIVGSRGQQLTEEALRKYN